MGCQFYRRGLQKRTRFNDEGCCQFTNHAVGYFKCGSQKSHSSLDFSLQMLLEMALSSKSHKRQNGSRMGTDERHERNNHHDFRWRQ